MSDYKPRFRRFLLAVNMLYLALQVWWHTLAGRPPAGVFTWWHQAVNWLVYGLVNLTQLLAGALYAAVTLGLEPVLAALSLGWLGGQALRALHRTPLAGGAYGQLALVLLVNTALMSLLTPDQNLLLGHLLFCGGSLLLAYRRVFFGRCPATCRLARRWLTGVGR